MGVIMENKKKSKNELLQETIFHKKKSAWDSLSSSQSKDVFGFAEKYKLFLDKSKTEREAVKEIVKELKVDGFKDICSLNKLKSGDKVFKIIKNRALICAVMGKELDSVRILGSHIDSPRLDIKPSPIYEDSSLCMMKTHYYGGIKKYHWVNLPLSMHATIHTSKGKTEIIYGEKEDEPKFIIPDLLPHLAKDQMAKTMKDGITGEDLHIVLGNIPVKDDDIKEKVKFNILKILNENYGIVEKDIVSADITFVPATKAMDIGFDKSMIASYGQDDRVCAYTTLKAMISTKNPTNTSICFFADKEEIGSYGTTGAQSRILENFILDLIDLTGSKLRSSTIFENSYALSCDVTDASNPIFKEVHDSSNVSFLGYGVSVEKYGGSGGKYSTNDASSEYMSWFVNMLDKSNVNWQSGELGKIDIGGGGTIAMYMAKYGLDVIDVGPSVLAMHSNAEVASKVDVYMAYLAYKLFLEN